VNDEAAANAAVEFGATIGVKAISVSGLMSQKLRRPTY